MVRIKSERSVWTYNQKAREVNKNISVWTTNFPNFLKLTKKERELNPNVLGAYKRPQTIATL